MEGAAERFVLAATSGRCSQARALLAADPEIERDPWAKLVLGRDWDGDPNKVGGPRDWAPLLYVCHSCFASAELARVLLARGAHPNASFTNEYGQMSALYGAAGVAHDPELTRALLEAGADPDDGESVYHSVEAESPECLKLLLAYGAETRGTNALAHALDYDRIEPVRLLLEGGADPNEGALLAHAVRRGRGPEALRLLVQHGADLERPGGLRTPYRHAVVRGRNDQQEALAELGASTDVTAEDQAVAAIARGEWPDAVPATLDPDGQEVVILAALRGRLELVVETFGVEFRGVVGGPPEGTLLHHAAWVGAADVVAELLRRGADPLATALADFETPLAWCVLASQYHELPGRDYARVAELLVHAGAVIEPRFLEVADGPLLDWLRDRDQGVQGSPPVSQPTRQ